MFVFSVKIDTIFVFEWIKSLLCLKKKCNKCDGALILMSCNRNNHIIPLHGVFLSSDMLLKGTVIRSLNLMAFPLVKSIKVDGILAFLQAPQAKFVGL